jgi:hypothetical protein
MEKICKFQFNLLLLTDHLMRALNPVRKHHVFIEIIEVHFKF